MKNAICNAFYLRKKICHAYLQLVLVRYFCTGYNKHLVDLNCNDNAIGSEGCRSLLRALVKHPKLKNLNLKGLSTSNTGQFGKEPEATAEGRPGTGLMNMRNGEVCLQMKDQSQSSALYDDDRTNIDK